MKTILNIITGIGAVVYVIILMIYTLMVAVVLVVIWTVFTIHDIGEDLLGLDKNK